MNIEKILDDSGSFLKGHFLLSSGLHSDSYIQCAKALMYPSYAENIASNIFEKTSYLKPDIIVSPALGGIIIGWEVARKFNIPFVFTEREGNKMSLRRGFTIESNNRVLIVEDVFTTGKSTLETVNVVKEYNGIIVGACAIVERGEIKFDFPHHYLFKVKFNTYLPSNCPLCRENIPIVKPGSRKIK